MDQDPAYLEWVKELGKTPIVKEFYAAKLQDLQKEKSELLQRLRTIPSLPLSKMDDVAEPVDLRSICYAYINKLLKPVERDIHKFTAKLRLANDIQPPKGTFDLPLLKQIPLELLLQTPPKHTSQTRLSLRCPFHEEKTPSFVVFKDQNTFHCFGCQAHGDSITFVQKLHKLDFKSACKFLTTYL